MAKSSEPRPTSPDSHDPADVVDPVALAAFVDDILEECARLRLSLRATFDRLLPAVAAQMSARAIVVRTKNEDLVEESFAWSADGETHPDAGSPSAAGPGAASRSPSGRIRTPAAAAKPGLVRVDGLAWFTQDLDLAGERIGVVSFAFEDTPSLDLDTLAIAADAVCEEVDGILWQVQTAATKQRLIERITRALTKTVFRDGLDEAIVALREEIPFERLALVFGDESNPTAGELQYRVYKGKRPTHDSEGPIHRALSAAIESEGRALLQFDRPRLATVLALADAVELPLVVGIAQASCVGKVVVSAREGISLFGRDLLRVLANAVSQRVVDYNRERRHLSHFFAPDVINELLADPAYADKHLSPRVESPAILFADINMFTRMCDRVLRQPDRVGRFVDRWSNGAVKILWRHGAVFDKMVGDCVIAHFGPPFYRDTPAERAAAALRAACEIQRFTVALVDDPDLEGMDGLADAGIPGLGVAVGVNICSVSVGLFGPNQEFTAFGGGMNQTARLQSHAGFREILVMDTIHDALGEAGVDPGVGLDGPHETRVKNVRQPLRYYRVADGGLGG